jgi:UDP-GlcNAc:undecaprenyl-phosphate GlcNAc-1-phosphate transferase
VCDGLVGSLGVAALIAAAIATGDVAAPVLAAATLGFLWFNRPPATIFLGDAGSHLLGFAIAYAWLPVASWHHAAAAGLGAGVFVLELGFLVIVRSRRGIPFWRGTPDHLALRLQAAGLSKQATIAVALVLAVAFDVLAVWLARAASAIAAAAVSVAIASTIVAVARLYALEPVPRLGRPREVHR